MIVLDTHAWVWWVSAPEQLSQAAAKAIDDHDVIGISAISVWEISTKVSRNKLTLDRDLQLWVTQALAHNERIVEIPLDSDVALLAGTLGARGFHGDPADRMLAATSLHLNAPLVSKDERLRKAPQVQVIW